MFIYPYLFLSAVYSTGKKFYIGLAWLLLWIIITLCGYRPCLIIGQILFEISGQSLPKGTPILLDNIYLSLIGAVIIMIIGLILVLFAKLVHIIGEYIERVGAEFKQKRDRYLTKK